MSASVPILSAGCHDLSRKEIADEDGYKLDDAVVMALVLLISIVNHHRADLSSSLAGTGCFRVHSGSASQRISGLFTRLLDQLAKQPAMEANGASPRLGLTLGLGKALAHCSVGGSNEQCSTAD
jgi:hypothetical protein